MCSGSALDHGNARNAPLRAAGFGPGSQGSEFIQLIIVRGGSRSRPASDARHPAQLLEGLSRQSDGEIVAWLDSARVKSFCNIVLLEWTYRLATMIESQMLSKTYRS
ncbi:hypothetical protein EMIT0P253_170060 [Pseudomonas sp. IT-P253]